jgi:RNA polymerase sigma-70 factor (ECF subfamily)
MVACRAGNFDKYGFLHHWQGLVFTYNIHRVSGHGILQVCSMAEDDSLARLKRGDKALFAGLVRDHHRALIALATPIVGSNDAEEVVQNAWIKAYQAIANFEARAQLRTWLSRIVINESRMLLRRRKRESLFADSAVANDSEQVMTDRFTGRFAGNGSWRQAPTLWHVDSPDALLMSDDLNHCLQRLLSVMPDKQRAVLEMRDASELTFDEICNNLSISASNARVLLHRARVQLFDLVDHYQETGEC